MMSFQASWNISVSEAVASIVLMRMAPMAAPIRDDRPPTAAQTTIEIEKVMSRKLGDANSAAMTYSIPAKPAMAADTVKKNT